MRVRANLVVTALVAAGVLAGCVTTGGTSDRGASAPLTEPAWIRDGEPLMMENNAWYPTDEVELLLDGEMFVVGQYRDVTVYAERADVKPFARLYTHFGRDQYRAFEPRS